MKLLKLLPRCIIFSLLSLWINFALADPPASVSSLGQTAGTVMGPLSTFTKILYIICYVLGICFLLGGIVRYKEYRQNPSETPVSRAISILIFGLIFLAIPMITKLSAAASILG